MEIYRCEPCKYVTSVKCHYTKHIESNKHKVNCAPSIEQYVCKDCNTKCSFRQSYERHRKYNCKILNNQLENIKDKYNEVLMRMTLLGLENNNILEDLKTLEQTIKLYKETKK
jgi:hypothetical protein